MTLAADAIYRAWRPRDFMVRMAMLFGGSIACTSLVVRWLVEPVISSGPLAIVGLLTVVGCLAAVPAVVFVRTAKASVRVILDRDGLSLVQVTQSALIPDLELRLPLRGLRATWHRDEYATNLVLIPSSGTSIALTTSERGVLDGLAKALAARGVPID